MLKVYIEESKDYSEIDSEIHIKKEPAFSGFKMIMDIEQYIVGKNPKKNFSIRPQLITSIPHPQLNVPNV